MKSGGSHAKGASFERHVCKSLSSWISDGERDDVFWRSVQSGGRATIGLNTELNRGAQAGDISAIASIGERLLNHVLIECKHYKDLGLFAGIVNDSGTLHTFWRQHKGYSRRFDRQPMIVARQNGMPAICLLPTHAALALFGLTERNAAAVLPRWGCSIILFDCFLREAQVPELSVCLEMPRRGRFG